ncbi:MAG: response regulator transcription factor [Pseudobacteriovorax sp.]|nr:response regulator transcription factor [Pseudobacteriovorax sp.]
MYSRMKEDTESIVAVKSKIPFWILEDDEGCNFIYEEILQHKYNYKIFKTLDEFRSAYFSAGVERPKLILADLRLPDGSFVSFLNELPQEDLSDLSIVIVSICDDLDIIRYCLGEGVIDYLTKPFNKSELLVKIERSLNRVIKRTTDLSVDPLRRRVMTKDNLQTELTSKELMIFDLINNAPSKQISRADLIGKVWKDVSVGSKTLDVHIFNIRRKLSKLNVRINYTPPQTYSIAMDNINQM